MRTLLALTAATALSLAARPSLADDAPQPRPPAPHADDARPSGVSANGAGPSRAEANSAGPTGASWSVLNAGAGASDEDGRVGGQRLGYWGFGLDVTYAGVKTFPSHFAVASHIAGLLDLGSGSGGGLAILGYGRAEANVDYVVPVGRDHGPLVGLGLGVETLIEPSFFYADLPRVEVGYQWQRSDLLLRATAYASFVAGGGALDQHASGTTTRAEVGGRLWASAFHGTGAYVMIDAHHLIDGGLNPGVPLDQITGSACLSIVTGWTVCGRSAFFRAPTPTVSQAQWRMWSIDFVLFGTWRTEVVRPSVPAPLMAAGAERRDE